jgi:hypothetical protein
MTNGRSIAHAHRAELRLEQSPLPLTPGRGHALALRILGRPWTWALGYFPHVDRTLTHSYAATREETMAAFAKSWRRQ